MSKAQNFRHEYYKLILAKDFFLSGTFTLPKFYSSFHCYYNVYADKSEVEIAKSDDMRENGLWYFYHIKLLVMWQKYEEEWRKNAFFLQTILFLCLAFFFTNMPRFKGCLKCSLESYHFRIGILSPQPIPKKTMI